MTDISSLLHKKEFPRSNNYDPEWMLENQMGPNAVWLVEWLSNDMRLEPGMRVLDLGCGKAMTSIFLATEFGVRVWAADLWIGPDNNWRRILKAKVEDLVYPMRIEAHALPFAQGFFDAVISIDAYTYFGTDSLYLNYLSGFVRPGGQIGIVVPGLAKEIKGELPTHLTLPQANGKVFWDDECWCFHTPDFWKLTWSRSSRVTDLKVEVQPEG